MRPLIFLVLSGCAATSAAVGSAAPGGREEASPARDLACSLADDVGPRLAGSDGDARAVQWALMNMKQLGLSNVRAEPVTVPHWVRGEARAELVAPFSRRFWVAALGGSIATPPGGVEADVVRVTSIEELRELPEERVKGRIVFFDKVMSRDPDGHGYGKTVDVRTKGAIEAAKKGAVASLIRSVGTSDARFPHTGAMRYADGVPKIAAAALAIPDAELLRRTLVKNGQPVRVKLELTPQWLPDAESANVIGEVPGSSKPEELVVLGAHLDSWDLGDGAIDDAAGVGIILDVARRLVAEKPARTVRVVLFANEENGLRGARAYAKAHADELPRHVAALEADSGAGVVTGVGFKGGPDAAKAMAALAPQLVDLGLPPPTASDAGGADTSELTGVPQVELDQDRSRYFDLHHTADDTCDKIQPKEISQAASVALVVTRYLANMPGNLGRRSTAD